MEEFKPGTPPEDPRLEILGFSQAIDNTLNTIKRYEANGTDTSELKLHLQGLEQGLEKAKEKRDKNN